MASPPPIVSFRNISKTFPGQRALESVSFTIGHGEVHALLGHNGSGKSTLIKVLAGVHSPDPGGSVVVNGVELLLGSPSASNAAGLRFVHQDLGLIDELSVLENMALSTGYRSTRAQTISWSEQRRTAKNLLRQLETEIDVDSPLRELAAVDRSIVAIARSLDGLSDHGLLVLDEPTAALPPDEVDRLFVVVRRLRERNVSTMYVTHRMDEVFEIADRLTVLRDGSVQVTERTDDTDIDRVVSLILGDSSMPAADESTTSPSSGAGQRDTQPILEVTALRSALIHGVDISLRAGEVVGIAGVFGSGREEFGPALIGAIRSRATSYATSLGQTVTITPRRTRELGVVLVPGTRGPGSLIEDFTVTENLTFPVLNRFRRAGVLDKRSERNLVGSWLDRFDIKPRRPSAALRELSGGNKQKVLVAKWMNTNPRVLVLDEPTAGVDVGSSAAIHAFIREVAKTGMGCIVASSDVADLTAVCTRVLVLRGGVVNATLTGDAINEERVLLAMSSAGDRGEER